MRALLITLLILSGLFLLGLVLAASADASPGVISTLAALLGVTAVTALIAFAYRTMQGDPASHTIAGK